MIQNSFMKVFKDSMLYLTEGLRVCTFFQQGLFLTYNFFNVEVSHPDIMVFDIQKCYTDKQQHRFQIKFPGELSFPYLLLSISIILHQSAVKPLTKRSFY